MKELGELWLVQIGKCALKMIYEIVHKHENEKTGQIKAIFRLILK